MCLCVFAYVQGGQGRVEERDPRRTCCCSCDHSYFCCLFFRHWTQPIGKECSLPRLPFIDLLAFKKEVSLIWFSFYHILIFTLSFFHNRPFPSINFRYFCFYLPFLLLFSTFCQPRFISYFLVWLNLLQFHILLLSLIFSFIYQNIIYIPITFPYLFYSYSTSIQF